MGNTNRGGSECCRDETIEEVERVSRKLGSSWGKA